MSYISRPASITQLGILNQLAAIGPFNSYNGGNVDIETTINHKRSVFADPVTHVPAAGELPRISCFGIGVNGVDGSGDFPVPYQTRGLNQGDLFSPVPMRVVLASADLSEEERANYRLRQPYSYGGTDYILYWYKVMDWTEGFTDNVNFAQVVLGESPTVVDPYGTIDMTPEPVLGEDIDSQVVAYLRAVCAITHDEIEDTFNILQHAPFNLSPERMLISELGIFTGIDREVVAADLTEYTESIYTQLMFHRCMHTVDLGGQGSEYSADMNIENGNLALL